MMLGIERRQKIAAIIQRDHKVYVAALSRLFQVTEETVRRDLEKLEKEGVLTRTYGGAVYNHHTNEDLSFPVRTEMNLEIKQLIGAKAAELINNGATIMLDTSTTCLEMLHTLKANKKNITVITNSVKITHDFINTDFTIISSGGTLRPHSFSLIGPIAQTTLKNYYVDMAIVSCKGLSMDKGIMESNELECEIKKSMIGQAQKVILLADHTKFDTTGFTKLIDFVEVNTIVTDQPPAADWLTWLETYDIELIC